MKNAQNRAKKQAPRERRSFSAMYKILNLKSKERFREHQELKIDMMS